MITLVSDIDAHHEFLDTKKDGDLKCLCVHVRDFVGKGVFSDKIWNSYE